MGKGSKISKKEDYALNSELLKKKEEETLCKATSSETSMCMVSALFCSSLPVGLYKTNIFIDAESSQASIIVFFVAVLLTASLMFGSYIKILEHFKRQTHLAAGDTVKHVIDSTSTPKALFRVNTAFLCLFLLFSAYSKGASFLVHLASSVLFPSILIFIFSGTTLFFN